MGKKIKVRMGFKEKKAETLRKAHKRDIALLTLLLRHRLTPPVPYIIITEIVFCMLADSYHDLCRKNCKFKDPTEKQKFLWFASWCRQMEKKELLNCGGRWVASVRWDFERVEELYHLCQAHLEFRGPVFEIVDQEGLNKLKVQVGRKKAIKRQKEILQEKEELMRKQENRGTLQANWDRKNDWRHGSVPDFAMLKPKSVVGQGYPFGDFLRPLKDGPWDGSSSFDMAFIIPAADNSCNRNSNFDTACTVSATSTHSRSSSSILTTWVDSSSCTISAVSTQSSSSSLTTWPNSSTAISSTIRTQHTDKDDTALKTVDGNATKNIEKAMRNKLEKMDLAAREGRLINDWMMTD